MKLFIYSASAVLFLLLTSCMGQKESIVGTIAGVDSDTVYVMKIDLSGKIPMVTDTVALVEDKFAYNITDTIPYRLNIVPAPKITSDNSMQAMRMQGVGMFYFPGDKLQVVAEFSPNDVTQVITGTPLYESMNKFEAANKALTDEQKVALETYMDSHKNAADSATKANTYNAYIAINNKLNDQRVDYIMSNPNDELSGMFFASIGGDKVAEAFAVLSESVKNGKFKDGINRRKDSFDQTQKIEKAKQNIQPGLPAPDFTLKNINGEDFKLSSVYNKNKYIVLDFWGSWCGWCIKGFPDMKKTYEKYSKKLEIISVDCGDTQDKWKKSVEENKLPWINVYNSDKDDVNTSYAVSGYPSKVIIAPDGKIVKIVLGESPEFYQTIDSLMKK